MWDWGTTLWDGVGLHFCYRGSLQTPGAWPRRCPARALIVTTGARANPWTECGHRVAGSTAWRCRTGVRAPGGQCCCHLWRRGRGDRLWRTSGRLRASACRSPHRRCGTRCGLVRGRRLGAGGRSGPRFGSGSRCLLRSRVPMSCGLTVVAGVTRSGRRCPRRVVGVRARAVCILVRGVPRALRSPGLPCAVVLWRLPRGRAVGPGCGVGRGCAGWLVVECAAWQLLSPAPCLEWWRRGGGRPGGAAGRPVFDGPSARLSGAQCVPAYSVVVGYREGVGCWWGGAFHMTGGVFLLGWGSSVVWCACGSTSAGVSPNSRRQCLAGRTSQHPEKVGAAPPVPWHDETPDTQWVRGFSTCLPSGYHMSVACWSSAFDSVEVEGLAAGQSLGSDGLQDAAALP